MSAFATRSHPSNATQTLRSAWAALGVGDGDDHDLLSPDHVSDVVFAEAWMKVHTADLATADVMEFRVAANPMTSSSSMPPKYSIHSSCSYWADRWMPHSIME
jgi:hypothetical protein